MYILAVTSISLVRTYDLLNKKKSTIYTENLVNYLEIVKTWLLEENL